MRERWRKNELKQETEWVPSGWVSHSNKGDETDRKRGREHRDKWSERWNVRRRAYVLAFVWNWAEVGFRNKLNGAFCTFFFFFFEFRPESAVSADSSPSRLDFGRIGPSWSRVGVSRQKARGIHVARRGRTRGQWCPLRVTASRCVGRGCGTSGAASVLHSSKLQHILGCACVHCT